jgi:hypothetical protein
MLYREHPYVTALNLNRLGERDIAALIDRVAGNKPLAASVREDIIESELIPAAWTQRAPTPRLNAVSRVLT